MNKENVELVEVDSNNWRDVASLEVSEEQKDFVASGSYYLCLCSYGKLWKPLAVRAGRTIIGFLMWAIDETEGSCWLGGIIIDLKYQGRGFGKAAVKEAVRMLSSREKLAGFALSYSPSNTAAAGLYRKLGFTESGEMEDQEIVARLSLDDAR